MGIGGFHKQQRRKMVKTEATKNGEERSWWWIVEKRRRQWTGRQLIGRLNHGENRRQKKNADVINNKAMIVPVFQVLAVLLPSRDRAARDAVWCLSAAVAAYWFFKWALQNSDAVRALKAAELIETKLIQWVNNATSLSCVSVYNHAFAFPKLVAIPATKRGNGGGGKHEA
ncbi:hypothetical protein LXL04_028739 [Taraxacum kok-saghyz]